MINELLRDPAIQQRYQFMLYMYPTGVPIPIAAAVLRESLREAEHDVQPQRQRPGVRPDGPARPQHGGPAQPRHDGRQRGQALAAESDRSFDEILGPPEVLDELRGYFFFKPLPFVSRVVFLATPAPRLGPEPKRRRPGERGLDRGPRPHQRAA